MSCPHDRVNSPLKISSDSVYDAFNAIRHDSKSHAMASSNCKLPNRDLWENKSVSEKIVCAGALSSGFARLSGRYRISREPSMYSTKAVQLSTQSPVL